MDEAVAKLGALTKYNVGTIADTITAKFSDKEQKARAIFYWIANNIAIDPKGSKQSDDKNNLPENVIELRKASPIGFSLLVQEMCSAANIRCLSVDGYVKNYPEEIVDPADEKNYSWNVIQLGQSPENWFYADACRAAGTVDKKGKIFTKEFVSEYFFADRQLFNLVYFPDNSAWQLGSGPKNKKEFFGLPVITGQAFVLGLGKPTPAAGLIKTKLKKPVAFSFPVRGEIKNISVMAGEEKKQPKPEIINFVNNNGQISFTYQPKTEGSFPVKIIADGKVILEYFAEFSE